MLSLILLFMVSAVLEFLFAKPGILSEHRVSVVVEIIGVASRNDKLC